MRNISCTLTKQQIIDRRKFHTRRLGWKKLKKGDQLQVCEKCMGLKKGEKVKKLSVIVVNDVWFEPLLAITDNEVVLEGFPEMNREQFIEMFCREMKCTPDIIVTVISFGYVFEKDGCEYEYAYACSDVKNFDGKIEL